MRQLRILHLSDIHFGPHHRCYPEDSTHSRTGYPSLFDLLAKDLDNEIFSHDIWKPGPDDSSSLIVIVSGDLTETASSKEFASAHAFFCHFDGAKLLGSSITRESIFIVPGNHDVLYTQDDPEARLAPYINFYSKLYRGVRKSITPADADELTQVHVKTSKGYVIAEINSSYHVQKGTSDEQRGNVDMRLLGLLRAQLSRIPARDLASSIRIAVLHHHPILIPALVEPGRGYDAVANSHHLLKLLREFGFQLVLHGHKHFPHLFSYDADTLWADRATPPMLVIAGGSTSSRELPSGRGRCNTYNLISIRWHPEAGQARAKCITRGLQTEDDSGEITPDLWHWQTLREVDRRLYPAYTLPDTIRTAKKIGTERTAESKRVALYGETRGNMVVSEVLPSLIPGQAYEVRVWIVPHVDQVGSPKPGWEPPSRVIWSAGPSFDRQEVLREDDPKFCSSYHYWAPMLVQAEMKFSDGKVGYAHTYARIPNLDRPASS